MKGNKKRSGKKSCKAQSMGLFLASVLVASAGGVQDVYAQNGKSQSAQEKQAEQSLGAKRSLSRGRKAIYFKSFSSKVSPFIS